MIYYQIKVYLGDRIIFGRYLTTEWISISHIVSQTERGGLKRKDGCGIKPKIPHFQLSSLPSSFPVKQTDDFLPKHDSLGPSTSLD